MRKPEETGAWVFDIYRGTIHDGPGMRTTIFMKGCPLHCKWCHNPEGMSLENHVTYEKKKCLGCRMCTMLAGKDIVTIQDGQPVLIAEHTDIPEKCVSECPGGALRQEAEWYSLDTLFDRAIADRQFFHSFGGGVTVSGGEPAVQYRAVTELLKKLKAAGIHTALDTSGFADWTAYEAMLPYVDLVLYDVKVADNAAHKQLTGVDNTQILENLHRLTAYRDKHQSNPAIWIRTPLIPKDTATQHNISAIGEILTEAGAHAFERWELCAFNNICVGKYEKTGRVWLYDQTPLMTDAEVQAMVHAGGTTFDPSKIVSSGFTRKLSTTTDS